MLVTYGNLWEILEWNIDLEEVSNLWEILEWNIDLEEVSNL